VDVDTGTSIKHAMNQDIEAYLDGTLDPEATAVFEAQLARDEVLQAAVAETQSLREDLRWLAVEQGLLQIEQTFWAKEKARKNRRPWIFLIIGFTILLIIGIIKWPWIKGPTMEAPKQADQPDSLPIAPENNSPKPINNAQTTYDSIQKEQKKTMNRLFAENFKPFKDESLEPSLRGDPEPTPSEKFQQLYWDGKYREALTEFESLSAPVKDNDNLLFLKAECLMALGKVEEAVPAYALILKSDKSRYIEVSAWHLALAYLKMGKTAQAKTQLQEIGRSGSKWRREATVLLKSIQ